ncbi:MAG TPA: CocE/NonD family hydrolase [Steroidobacteraceae bacterium]|nr:CocE/NonD family hydrolase [Steroidobacteraceae bacterium]
MRIKPVFRNGSSWRSPALVALLWAASQALAGAAPPRAADSAPVPAPTAAASLFSPSPMQPFWARRITGYLTTRDGVRLRYSALLPRRSGRFPVIMNYSGYDPGAIGGWAYLHGQTAMSASIDRTLLEHGYAVIGVNARGTGCSEGEFNFLGLEYGEDGRDAVEFAAAQPWSDGSVGMANWSWAGMSQIATASERPPHLKAIAPGMVVGDMRLDSWYPGGVPAPYFIANWRMFLHSTWASAKESAEHEGDVRCVGQIARNLESEERHAITTEVMRHPLRDAWIQIRNLSLRTHSIDVPVLSMESFQDEAVTSREGYYQDTLDPDRVWMVQTNGGHDLYESRAFRPTLLAFFDRFVKGIHNGFGHRPHLEVWMGTVSRGQGFDGYNEAAAPGWEFHRASIRVPVRPVAFALAAEGMMLPDGSGSSAGPADSFRYPSPGPAVDTGFLDDSWGPEPAHWRTGSLAYTSPPLAKDLLAYGTGSVDLYVSSSSSDADLQVTLTALTPTGREVFIQRGWLRLSDRAINEGASTPLRPVLVDTPEAVRALDPGVPAHARVELNKFAYAFRKGDRIRLWIDTPSFWGGYGFAYDPLPATIRVWHDADHPSRLVLGELDGVPIPAATGSRCDKLKEPCRRDPLSS